MAQSTRQNSAQKLCKVVFKPKAIMDTITALRIWAGVSCLTALCCKNWPISIKLQTAEKHWEFCSKIRCNNEWSACNIRCATTKQKLGNKWSSAISLKRSVRVWCHIRQKYSAFYHTLSIGIVTLHWKCWLLTTRSWRKTDNDCNLWVI